MSLTFRRLGAYWRAYVRRRYAILFYTLLLTLVVAPAFAAFELGTLIELLLAINLLIAMMSLASGKSRRIAICLLSVMWLARPATAWLEHQGLSAMTLGMWTLIGLFAAAAALRSAMSGARKVDSEHLYAALGGYLLAGIFFGVLYWVLEQTWPGTFAGSAVSRMGAIYFSFVTLASLGTAISYRAPTSYGALPSSKWSEDNSSWPCWSRVW